MKVLVLIVGSLLAAIASLTTIHFWGLSQNYIPYDNQFFSAKTPWIVIPWEQSYFLDQKRDLVLLAKVYRTQNQTLLIAPSLEEKMKSRDREQKPSPARPLLADFLRTYKDQRVILDIIDNVEDIHVQLAKVITPFAKSEHIMIQSDYNNVMLATKELLPRLVYGSSPSDTMRLKSFDALGVVTATPFQGDVFFSSILVSKRTAINQGIATELHRRYKKIILGPINNLEEAEQALRLGADGLIIEKPEWILQWLRTKN